MNRLIQTSADFGALVAELGAIKDTYTVTVTMGRDRTKEQNNLVHKWFDQIAKQLGDQSAAEVKAECNLDYGRPIMARDDPEWEAAFGYIFDSLSRPAKLKAIRLLDIPFTRRMKVPQLREYMDQMQRDYSERGVRLIVPEDRRAAA